MSTQRFLAGANNMLLNYSLNINDQVSVSLTPYGKKVYQQDVEKHYGPVAKDIMAEFEHKNIDNILTTELWKLMSIFGKHMYMGCEQVFVNNKIRFKKED